jgi:hypothetical protein
VTESSDKGGLLASNTTSCVNGELSRNPGSGKKERWGSCRPGALAGSIVESTDKGVFVTVSQEKWEKLRRYIGEIIEELVSLEGTLDFKNLEKKQGFLIYITQTYPLMVPYLKGIHQTLDGWRPNRDTDG